MVAYIHTGRRPPTALTLGIEAFHLPATVPSLSEFTSSACKLESEPLTV